MIGKTRLLVTGGTGFVGGALSAAWCQSGQMGERLFMNVTI